MFAVKNAPSYTLRGVQSEAKVMGPGVTAAGG